MLFADIKGSMELIEDLDPEEARAIVDPALKLMMEAVQRYGGYVAQSTGDGIFALFGAPLAHEDHPQRALYAAVRMQEDLKRYSDRIRAEGRLPIQARVGVNTGEAVVRSITTGEGRTDYAPVGHSTGIAARMQALAPVGSIAATEPLRKLCEGYFVFKSLGPTKVKGVSEPVNVYEVTGLGPLRTRLQRAAARGYTKFVGRQREMETIEHAAELARTGHSQIVVAVAEAGVGKSRLFHEFKARNQFGWMVLEAFSVSRGKSTAYLPVIELLHGYFRIAADDDQRTRREKVNGGIVALDPALQDTRPYLFALLGLVEGEDSLGRMDPQIRRQRTQNAIRRILLRESLNQPVMLVFEDLHQIDDETQAFLNQLVDSIGTSRILLLVNYRPEYSHSWSSKTFYTQVRLDPLDKARADQMLTALLGSDESVIPLKRLIEEKTEGNPLFIEEIYQALIEEGALVLNGAVRITRPLNALKIPATVQAILAARVDRLPVAEKELVQTLAVIGKRFQLKLAVEVAGKSQQELIAALDKLQEREFIYEQPSQGDVEYEFKHALTQEVAYNSLLIERRKAQHERTAAAIESLYRANLDDHLSELTNHYGRSANTRKTVEYRWRSGRQAALRSAYKDGFAHLTRGLELLRQLPDDSQRQGQELRLQRSLVECWTPLATVASPEMRSAMERIAHLSEQVGDRGEFFRALLRLCDSCLISAELSRAGEYAQRALTLAGNAPAALAWAHELIGQVPGPRRFRQFAERA
jgi:class 3 adenylate cyclase